MLALSYAAPEAWIRLISGIHVMLALGYAGKTGAEKHEFATSCRS